MTPSTLRSRTAPSWSLPTRLQHRLLSKLAAGDEGQGATARRSAVYKEVLEDASTGATLSFASAVEFRRKSNDTMGELWEWAHERKKSALEKSTRPTKKAAPLWWSILANVIPANARTQKAENVRSCDDLNFYFGRAHSRRI